MIRISQFLLRERVGEIRDDLQEKVVETALFLNEVSSFEDVIATMKRDILVELPRPLVKTTISRLVQKGRVKINGAYRLDSDRRAEIKKQMDSYQTSVDDVTTHLASKVEEKLRRNMSVEDRGLVREGLFRALSSLFVERAEISARLIAKPETVETTPPAGVGTIEKSLQFIADLALREALRFSMLEILQHPTDELANFLLRLNENLVCIEVLNLDPECQTLEKDAFSRTSLFLDTNVIVSLLCRSSKQHLLARELVSVTSQVGVTLLVTRETIREFLDVLEDANMRFQSIHRVPTRFLKAMDDEFIASYGIEKEENPHRKWEGYYLRMQQAVSILKNNYGISLYDKKHDEIFASDYFEEVSRRVSDCYEKMRRLSKKKKVCDHDAYHIVLVRMLRKENEASLVGPSHWFLTLDQSLPCVDPLVSNKLAHASKTLSSMVADIWLQMIEPFLSRDVRDKQAVQVFSELLSSQFGRISFRIDPSVIAELQGDWLDYEWLQPEDIEKIIGEKFVNDYLSRVREMRQAGLEAGELTAGFRKKLELRVNTLASDKIQKLNQKVEALGARIDEGLRRQEELRTQLTTEIRFRQTWRSVSGVIGVILLLGSLLLFAEGLIQSNFSTLVYLVVMLLFGAILLFFAIAPERVMMKIGASLSLTSQSDKEK